MCAGSKFSFTNTQPLYSSPDSGSFGGANDIGATVKAQRGTITWPRHKINNAGQTTCPHGPTKWMWRPYAEALYGLMMEEKLFPLPYNANFAPPNRPPIVQVVSLMFVPTIHPRSFPEI